MIGQPDLEWGQHAMGFAGRMAWVLPNPSGLNRSFSLNALVAAYSEFRTALLGSSTKRIPGLI
jgi:TDG/mug DNA glycosylase family protein